MSGIFARIIGFGTMGLVAYDAHRSGKTYAARKPDINERKRIDSLYLSKAQDTSASSIGNSLQREFIKQRTGTYVIKNLDTLKSYVFHTVGYVLTGGLIPLALAASTFVKNKIIRGVGLAGLAVYGLHYFLTHVLRFGKGYKEI